MSCLSSPRAILSLSGAQTKPPGMLIGSAALGKILLQMHWMYCIPKDSFPKLLPILQLLFAPLVWCGRHAMLIYITHQPIFLLAIYLFRFTGAGR